MQIRSRLLAGTLAAWLLAVNGCGTVPTAPQIDPGGAPAGSSMKGGAAGGAMAESRGDPASLVPRDILPPKLEPPILEPALETTETIAGTIGGTLSVDAVQLDIPKDAIDGSADVTLRVSQDNPLEVQLEISPADKNHFDTPVKLQFDVSAAQIDPRVMVIFWFDPSTNLWVPVPTTVDAAHATLSADLPHFSRYKAASEVEGRAGW